MPRSPFDVIPPDEDSLRRLAIEQLSTIAANPPVERPKIRPGGRLYHLVNEIYDRFVDRDTPSLSRPHLAATDFDDLREQYANITINKARRYLGIRSIRHNGRWWWKFPRHSAREAFAESHRLITAEMNPYAAELSRLNRPSCRELLRIMEDHRLSIRNHFAYEYMRLSGYTRNTTNVTKSILGISSKKIDGEWYWLYVPSYVKDWIVSKFSIEKIEVEDLFDMAANERGWIKDIVQVALEREKRIQVDNIGGKWVCYNPETYIEPNTVEIDNTPDEPSDEGDWWSPEED
jgi:hypothetical protein